MHTGTGQAAGSGAEQAFLREVRARVGGEVGHAHVGTVDVGVELRGRDVGVAEDLLDDAQVRAAFEHVRGEAVAQRVGVQALDAGEPPVPLADGMHRLARDAPAPCVQEHRAREPLAHELRTPAHEVVAQSLCSFKQSNMTIMKKVICAICDYLNHIPILCL